jgi:hypothetical protein
VHGTLLDRGLERVETVVHARSWQGGAPGSWHARATLRQFWPRLLETDLTEDDLRATEKLMADPRLHVGTYPLLSTSGRRP